MRYVEGNPVRARLVSSAKEWLWSSHKESIYKVNNPLIEEVPIRLPEDWDRYVDEPLTEKELERLRQSVKRQSPYEDPEWQARICKDKK